MILPWNRCRTETRIELESVGSRQKLANSESNEPLLGAWQTGHSFGSTKQLWQVKCPQLVNEPGTISSPAPQTCLKQFWRKSETNHVPMTKKKDMKEYVPGTNTRESFQADFDLSWVLMAHDFKLQRGARTSMTSSAGVTPCIRIFSCTGFSQFRRVRYKPLPWARKKLAHLSAVANGVPALLGWMTWRCDRGNFTHTV